jgi:histidine triad (HIT) family protein
MDCLFCKIVNKEIPAMIVYENETTLSFMDINPNSEGHVLVIPKNHCVDFDDASNEDAIEVVKTKKIVTKLLKEKLKPVGFNFVSNMGVEARQVVFHYHEHIIPKYEKDLGYSPSVVRSEKDQEPKAIFEILTK